jgi:hypothetical protein
MSIRIARVVALAAIAAAAVAQYFIRQDPTDSLATTAMLLAALVAAFSLTRAADPQEGKPAFRPADAPAWRFSWLGSTLATGGAALLIGGAATLVGGWATAFYRGWLLVVAGTAAMSAGLRLLEGPGARTWRRSDTVALAAIVAIGAALRFDDFSEFPGAFTTHAIEEQQTGLGGYRVLLRNHRPWEFWLDYQLTALALWFDPKPTFNTIRLPYTIVSALTPIPVYFLLRGLVRTPAARFGTLLYALLGWNLVYSRCAHPIFPTNILVITVLAMLVHYGRTRRLAVLPWIGLLSGYTLYSYAGYRGTPLFAGAFLSACTAAGAWRWYAGAGDARCGPARDLAALLLFVAVTVAVAAPIAKILGPSGRTYYLEAASRALANQEYYTDDAGKFVEQRLVRMRQSAEIFMHLGDGSLTFNVPARPMLEPVTAVLFVIGLFIACLRPGRSYHAFLVFMFLALMLVGTVFVQNLDVRRLQGITVFVAAFCAIVFDYLWGWNGERWRGAMTVAAVAIGAYLAWSSYDLYFRRMAGDALVRMAFRDQYTTLIHWGYDQPARRPILLQSIVHRFFDRSYHYRYNYSWLIDEHLEGQDLGDAAELLEPKTFGGAFRTVVSQETFERHALARLLRAAYPGTRCEEFSEPESARTALTVCDLPERLPAPRVRATLRARYAFDGDASGKWFLQREEPFLGYGTYPRSCYMPRPGRFCRAQWEGSFTVPAGGEYQVALTLAGRTQASATVDGTPLPPHGMPIAAGTHSIQVEATLPRDWEAGVRLSLRNGGAEEVVPFYVPDDR